MAVDPMAVAPGHSLGFITLGASLQSVLTTIKQDKAQFPAIDLAISSATPLTTPVIVTLPHNGIRLRFDATDQRLRLIELLDFTKTRLTYKGSELVKKQEDGSSATFKRIYQLFGASYPGEYLAPKTGRTGTYVLSWPGIAFNFPLQHSAWAPDKDHVSLLGSQAASAATQMAVFEGNSWPETRSTLFVKTPSGPRQPAISSQPRDVLPPEIELASVQGAGKVTFIRRSPAAPFDIILNQTTAQDLITELGPPDATHQRDQQVFQDDTTHPRPRTNSRSLSNGRPHPTPPSSYSSTGTDTFDTDFDSGDAEDEMAERIGRETFWCYFGHGVDILLGPPSDQASMEDTGANPTPLSSSPHLVVLKIVLHGNIPGSYAFNRHRRLRWTIELRDASSVLSSEHPFDDIKPDLMQAFHNVWPESEMGRGKVVNRTWGADPSDSSFFLPDEEQDLVETGSSSEQWLGNTKLYSFPGLTFEVLTNGAISALTVS
ncbi:hypothetical protein M409DRAFT_49629 [Zasmidium cellare ATCC 36951]|uniref:Uncharacterized protein n=1 Tax=Zasmidium cellare ATCC 36951 TaxID=1080233 RepID=A0A6A6D652_ZASCE|nr:uncharacterized protein M409DRAFT_49629 [Zasmidium cellare ATCC 36951]KAF2173146.1 hypothetical protein M409DRAFT_49629 [Zasmidium cellare ATCC 36951]